jgi:hypothetical protein
MEFLLHKNNGKWLNTGKMTEHNRRLDDGSYRVMIEPASLRTSDQNRYYWGIVVNIVFKGLKDAGHNAVRDESDTHAVLKSLFLKVQFPGFGGELMEYVKSTTELSTIEFADYLMKIFIWAHEYLGVTIPKPNEQLEFKL